MFLIKGYLLEHLGIVKHLYYSRWFLEFFVGIIYNNGCRILFPMGVKVCVQFIFK